MSTETSSPVASDRKVFAPFETRRESGDNDQLDSHSNDGSVTKIQIESRLFRNNPAVLQQEKSLHDSLRKHRMKLKHSDSDKEDEEDPQVIMDQHMDWLLT